jgi:hypothetical protein
MADRAFWVMLQPVVHLAGGEIVRAMKVSSAARLTLGFGRREARLHRRIRKEIVAINFARSPIRLIVQAQRGLHAYTKVTCTRCIASRPVGRFFSSILMIANGAAALMREPCLFKA